MKTSTGSWEDGKEPSEVRWSCGGIEVGRFGSKKSRAENHCRAENGVTVRGGMQLEGVDQAG